MKYKLGLSLVAAAAFPALGLAGVALNPTGITFPDGSIQSSAATSAANVITVAKSGGDFDNPVDALESITDASASNRYLVKIGPGEYELPVGPAPLNIPKSLKLKSYVTVVGSGVLATIIQGELSGGVVTVEDSGAELLDVELSNLTILSVSPSGPRARDATPEASTAARVPVASSIGIKLSNTVTNQRSNPYLNNLRVIAEEGSSETIAIDIDDSVGTNQTSLYNLVALAEGSGSVGIKVIGAAGVIIERVYAQGGTALALGSVTYSEAIIYSQLNGATTALSRTGSTSPSQTVLAHSHLVDSDDVDTTGVTCVAVTTPTAMLSPSCSSP